MLCESAQRYRALMVTLQSHRTQNMILRCYPNVSAILRRHTKSCVCAFSTIPIFPPFNSQNFLFTCILSSCVGGSKAPLGTIYMRYTGTLSTSYKNSGEDSCIATNEAIRNFCGGYYRVEDINYVTSITVCFRVINHSPS